MAVLRADFSKSPLEMFDKKEDQQARVTYYEAHLVCRLRVTSLALLAELWWDDRCMDGLNISHTI